MEWMGLKSQEAFYRIHNYVVEWVGSKKWVDCRMDGRRVDKREVPGDGNDYG